MDMAGPSEHQKVYIGWTRALQCRIVSLSFYGEKMLQRKPPLNCALKKTCQHGYGQAMPQQQGKLSGVLNKASNSLVFDWNWSKGSRLFLMTAETPPMVRFLSVPCRQFVSLYTSFPIEGVCRKATSQMPRSLLSPLCECLGWGILFRPKGQSLQKSVVKPAARANATHLPGDLRKPVSSFSV